MLFNSLSYLLVFLLIALGVVCLAVYLRRGKDVVLGLIVGASLVFYGSGRLEYVPLFIASISVNFALGRLILSSHSERHSRSAFWLGVVLNLGALGYFKYKNFFLESVTDLIGSDFTPVAIALPLAISFYTFQKITFLADCRTKKIGTVTFTEYVTFVSFFPQLIAGPIVRFMNLFLSSKNWQYICRPAQMSRSV